MLKKITDFIVEKRYFILGAFAILTVVGVFLMGKVKINSDMMEYLPKDSETRIGLDAMTAEFGEDEESDLSVMFENLDENGRENVKNFLSEIDGVSAVAYEHNADFEREYEGKNYTRYDLTVAGQADSTVAAEVYQKVLDSDYAKNYTYYLNGSVDDENGEVLHFSIIVLAVVAALIILIIMSESYVEPFLFLATILIAVVLNKATNLMFPSVSNITDSIVAILQMALSMDYSIMLMNRYIQERETESNKIKAMKKALFAAFTAISSSSVTTIVGLLALVFMSFTIGRDLGFVLAKGVLFSLIAIFTCLPSLILLFDKLIEKTKKPSPHFKMKWAGNASYKVRFLGVPVFIAVFIASFVLKGNLGIFYSNPMEDKIKDVFGSTNQFAVLYDRTDESKVAEFCRSLKDDEKINQTLCYGNTIGDKLSVSELPERMTELGKPVEIDDYLLKLIYYYYYHDGQGENLTLAQFSDFVREDVAGNPAFAEKISPNMQANLNKLANFSHVSSIQAARNAKEISAALDVDENLVEDLMIYYNSQNVQAKIQLAEFVEFIDANVLPSKYGANFDEKSVSKLHELESMLKLLSSTEKLDMATMAKVSGLNPEMVGQVYQVVAMKMQAPVTEVKLTPREFIDIVSQVAGQSAGTLDAETLATLNQVTTLLKISEQKLSYQKMAEALGMPAEQTKLLYSLYEIKYLGKEITLSFNEFVNFLTTDVMKNPSYSGYFDAGTSEKIFLLQNIMQGAINGKTYSPTELTNTLKGFSAELDKSLVELVYLYYGSVKNYDEAWKLSVEDFVTYLDKVILVDTRFNDFVSDEMRGLVSQAVTTVADAKKMLVGENYSRIVLNTTYDEESEETFSFIRSLKENLASRTKKSYVIGNSLLNFEMSESFADEMNLITILTMVFIFVVVAVTFKSLITPVILVALIQCAVYFTMGIMTVVDGEMYFIAILIVQSILMGATIDYAILYTSYYIEARREKSIKESLGFAYTHSLHAIMTSGLILILVTLIVGNFASAVAAKICLAISEGTTCSILLILILLPAMLATCDKLVVKKALRAKAK